MELRHRSINGGRLSTVLKEEMKMITIGLYLTINLVVFGGAAILIGLGIIPSESTNTTQE